MPWRSIQVARLLWEDWLAATNLLDALPRPRPVSNRRLQCVPTIGMAMRNLACFMIAKENIPKPSNNYVGSFS